MASVQTAHGAAGLLSDLSGKQPAVQEPEPMEEELEDVPPSEKVADPLYRLQLRREVDGQVLDAVVDDIEVGVESGERLYLIRYSDGDIEHMTAAEVRCCAKNVAEPEDEADDVDECNTEPATKKRPAAAAGQSSVKAAEKPSAKAKAKASSKPAAQPAGKKAAAKVVMKKPAKK